MEKGASARLCAAGVFLLLSARALATTVEQLTLGELVSRAERIVEGEVSDIAAAKDLRGRPATRLTIDVKTTLKGDLAQQLEILIPGGIDEDGVVLTIPGMPAFRKEERIVLFASAASKSGIRVPIGLGQGVYRASAVVNTKKTLYTPDLTGAELVDPATKKPVEARAVSIDRDEFLQQIRGLLEKK